MWRTLLFSVPVLAVALAAQEKLDEAEQEFEDYLILLSRFLSLTPQQREAIADELRDHMHERLETLRVQEGLRLLVEEGLVGGAAALRQVVDPVDFPQNQGRRAPQAVPDAQDVGVAVFLELVQVAFKTVQQPDLVADVGGVLTGGGENDRGKEFVIVGVVGRQDLLTDRVDLVGKLRGGCQNQQTGLRGRVAGG